MTQDIRPCSKQNLKLPDLALGLLGKLKRSSSVIFFFQNAGNIAQTDHSFLLEHRLLIKLEIEILQISILSAIQETKKYNFNALGNRKQNTALNTSPQSLQFSSIFIRCHRTLGTKNKTQETQKQAGRHTEKHLMSLITLKPIY